MKTHEQSLLKNLIKKNIFIKHEIKGDDEVIDIKVLNDAEVLESDYRFYYQQVTRWN